MMLMISSTHDADLDDVYLFSMTSPSSFAKINPLRPKVNSPAFAKQMAAAYLALPHRCHQSRPRPTKPNGGVLCEDASRGSRTTPVPKEEHEETQTSPGVKPAGTKRG